MSREFLAGLTVEIPSAGGEAVRLRVESAGEIVVSGGTLVAFDPVEPENWCVSVEDVPDGTYRCEVTFASTPSLGEHVAYLSVIVAEGDSGVLKIAVPDDGSALPSYCVPTDSALVAMAGGGYHQHRFEPAALVQELADTTRSFYSCAVEESTPQVVVARAWCDGLFPVWKTLSHDGELLGVHVDFHVSADMLEGE